MKKTAIAILLFLMPSFVWAQKSSLRVPDNEAILKEIFTQDSPYYYPFLMARYMQGDRTLTDADYHYLYYGYAFQPTYKPLEPDNTTADILTIIDRTPEPDSAGCRRIIALAEKGMARDPFSPTNLNMMAYVQTILGDTASARTNAIRVEKILATIKNSGYGVTERSPWGILSFAHAEDVLASMEVQAVNRRVVSRTVEYVDIGKRDERVKGFFFDFGRIYWNKPDNLPQKGPRGFQINGITVK